MFRSIRWLIVGLLFIAGVINYLDRSALSIAAPLIQKDLELDHAQMGVIFSSFFAGYAIFNFIGGWLSDRIGPKTVFTGAMGMWSLFCGLTAAATGFVSMIVLRVLFGVGEGPLSSTMSKTVSNWFPRREAATAIGIVNCGTPLGGAVAGPIVGYLALAFGWRLAFVIIMLLGFVWLVFWVRMSADKPAQHPRITDAELRLIEEGQTQADTAAQLPAHGLGFYLRQPVVLATAFAFFTYNYVLFFFLTWFPSYLTEVHKLSIKDMSLATVVPWLLGFVGLALGGFLSDRLFRMTGRALFSRKLVLIGGLGLAAVGVALAGDVSDVVSAVALMSVSIFGLYLTGAIYWAVIQDVVRGENVGGVGGFIHFLANLAGIIGPSVTGFIIQATGGVYTSAFVLAGGLAVLGALASLIFIREPRGAGGIAAQGAR
ncbi:MFS transporter [Inquilinus limosus]|uniref:MFS transporter n=1 Tax=Inquilinus limosus TaxID=171674 RepID=A0A211ZHG1_9PROT|nr:MFS transporter [Inquilinus limosus]OWJ64711.1 MFS transporter [Inquilinus limosus]